MSAAVVNREICILAYPGAQRAAVLGLTDLFEGAERARRERGVPESGLVVRCWETAAGLPAPKTPLAALILPPSLTDTPPGVDAAITDWIAARHREGTLVCSVCAGAFLLAETGLLDGRAATTHWLFAAAFAARFPRVALDLDKLIIEDGDIITAGGVMAWVDLGLRLVGRLLGTTLMLTVARLFLIDPGGREQRFYRLFSPPLLHGDEAVLRAQHWLQRHSGEHVTLPMMAAAAGLGERTLLRRFRRATSLTPAQYLQQLRVTKAREMLESTRLSIDEIAWRVGYEDGGAFRKVFHRALGLGPGEYRRRFTCAAAPAAGTGSGPRSK